MSPQIDTPSALGAAIRKQRKDLQLTQDDLALAIGVDRKVIYRLERGTGSVQLDIALNAARAVGLDLYARPRGKTGA